MESMRFIGDEQCLQDHCHAYGLTHLCEAERAGPAYHGGGGGGVLEIRVRRSYEPETFVLLPFGPSIAETASGGKASLPVQLVITPHGVAEAVLDYHLKARPLPKILKFSGEHAPILMPFWALASTPAAGAEPRASDGSAAVPLAYRTAKVAVPVQQGL